MSSNGWSYLTRLQAFTWDWLMAIPEEYNIIRKARFSWPNIIYFLSRSVFYDKVPFSCSPSVQTPIDSQLSVFVYWPWFTEVTVYLTYACDWSTDMAWQVAPIDDCNALKYVGGMFLEIGVAATSLLFFIRVRAVYNHSRTITALFGSLWLAVAGAHTLLLLEVTRGAYFGCLLYDDVRIRINWQITYHTRDAVLKAPRQTTLLRSRSS